MERPEQYRRNGNKPLIKNAAAQLDPSGVCDCFNCSLIVCFPNFRLTAQLQIHDVLRDRLACITEPVISLLPRCFGFLRRILPSITCASTSPRNDFFVVFFCFERRVQLGTPFPISSIVPARRVLKTGRKCPTCPFKRTRRERKEGILVKDFMAGPRRAELVSCDLCPCTASPLSVSLSWVLLAQLRWK